MICIDASGCAAVFKGYEDSVLLGGFPEDIRVVTSQGVELIVEDAKTGKIEILRDERG